MKNEKRKDVVERSYQYSLDVISFLKTLPKNHITLTLSKQLVRSSTSVGANIVEAQGASSKKDFALFFSHAFKSALESHYWIRILRDSENIQPHQVEYILQETQEISNILGASLKTLRKK